MKEFISLLLFIIGCLVGGIVGYTYSTDDMQEEAVANGHALYVNIEDIPTSRGTIITKRVFSWKDTATCCK